MADTTLRDLCRAYGEMERAYWSDASIWGRNDSELYRRRIDLCDRFLSGETTVELTTAMEAFVEEFMTHG